MNAWLPNNQLHRTFYGHAAPALQAGDLGRWQAALTGLRCYAVRPGFRSSNGERSCIAGTKRQILSTSEQTARSLD